MISEEISMPFAEFVINNLENIKRYELDGNFINEGIYQGTSVVIIENSNQWSGKIKTFNDVYVALLIEYLDSIEES